jgi:hypothetical protein
MSDITVDTVVKTTLSSSTTIQSPMTPLQPISPGTTENMVDLHRDNPITIYNVTKGLATIIRKYKEGYTLNHLTITNKI